MTTFERRQEGKNDRGCFTHVLRIIGAAREPPLRLLMLILTNVLKNACPIRTAIERLAYASIPASATAKIPATAALG
jgi:hypothetical protein